MRLGAARRHLSRLVGMRSGVKCVHGTNYQEPKQHIRLCERTLLGEAARPRKTNPQPQPQPQHNHTHKHTETQMGVPVACNKSLMKPTNTAATTLKRACHLEETEMRASIGHQVCGAMRQTWQKQRLIAGNHEWNRCCVFYHA